MNHCLLLWINYKFIPFPINVFLRYRCFWSWKSHQIINHFQWLPRFTSCCCKTVKPQAQSCHAPVDSNRGVSSLFFIQWNFNIQKITKKWWDIAPDRKAVYLHNLKWFWRVSVIREIYNIWIIHDCLFFKFIFMNMLNIFLLSFNLWSPHFGGLGWELCFWVLYLTAVLEISQNFGFLCRYSFTNRSLCFRYSSKSWTEMFKKLFISEHVFATFVLISLNGVLHWVRERKE